MQIISKPYFDYLVWREALYRPSFIRRGQQVFNSVENHYGSEVARSVQFVDGVDCFYDDSQIEEFLEHAYQVYCRLNRAENETRLREIFSDKEKINNLKLALEEIEKHEQNSNQNLKKNRRKSPNGCHQ
ncbi:MAG: hypothetical protein J6X18_04790 [Bacteroidales bacterium]|nr:hypothetical protein [Bacteroidales bacterium]